MTNILVSSINDRIAIEREDATMNDNKSKTFERIMKSATNVIAKTFEDMSIDMSFIAARKRKTAMFNVYGVERTIDLAAFLSGNAAINHFTLNICKSLFALKNANIDVMSHSAARVCCTALKDETNKVEKDTLKCLSRVSKAIALSTVNTQATITLEALRVFRIIEATSTANGEKAYRLTSDASVETLKAQMTKHNMI